ncbi:MAG: sensor domain-containing diguanylate cyclase [Gammaproteobacteria bacterium]|nr:sensor domain-containing diguanylate cyclase [Gammaproteobacteria bacterium]
MKHIVLALSALINLLLVVDVFAQPIDLELAQTAVNGEYVQVMQEQDQRLLLSEALTAYQQGRFSAVENSVLNFGIAARPVWLFFTVKNSSATSQTRRLIVKTPWLDKISLYFLHNDQLQAEYQAGDTLPYDQRAIKSRYFEFDHAYMPSLTTVMIRVETPDPMVLPIYLNNTDSVVADNTAETYLYGFVYGVLFALSVYNLILFFSLKSSRYLYYTLYLTAFLIMNITYSGHGYQWLWPSSPRLQTWFNPLFMVLYSFVGLVFTSVFLQTKHFLPKLHGVLVKLCLFIAIAFIVSVLLGSQVGALLIAFMFALSFPLVMVLLGGLSLFYGNQAAKYFLVASVTHSIMVIITAMTVWGLIPYTSIGFHSLELGMTIDAILLSIALADQLRLINEKKLYAEQLAMTDHLTGLYNRRAFYQLVNPMWNTGMRKSHDICVLLLDVDQFKDINDRYGHAQGDEILVKLSIALRESARAGDVVARWGGEEFIIFLPETNHNEAYSIAERMRKNISGIELKNNSDKIKISVSIGLAHNDRETVSVDQLIEVSDKYLYAAKAAGRNRVCAPFNCELNNIGES